MPALRLAQHGAPGRLVGQKVGGSGDGAHGKHHHNSSQDEEHLQVMKQKIDTLQADLSRRQESYIRRERAFNMRIEELEEEVSSLKSGKMSWMQGNHSMESLKNMHQQILHNVEMVQDRSSKILQEQEKDLLRAFRARLFDVQTELEKEKSRKDGGDSAWIERTRQTEAELDWAKEMADRLDRVNQGLGRENLRLKSQFKSQEDDRKFLIRQLVAVKKENECLRQETEAAEATMNEVQQKAIRDSEDMALAMRTRPRSSASAPNLPGLGGGGSSSNVRQAGVDADSRYKEIIKRLKRLLETERRNLRQVRASYAAELQQRTELENLLRAAVEEVKIELATKKNKMTRFGINVAGGGGTGKNASGGILSTPSSPGSGRSSGGTAGDGGSRRRHPYSAVSVSSFSSEDREQTLQILLSRERVLSLLYDRTFPLSAPPRPTEKGDEGASTAVGGGGAPAGGGAGGGDMGA